MSLKDSFKEEAAREKEKLKAMSFRDKLWYIWEYYRLHMLGAVLAVLVVWIIGNAIYAQTLTTRISIAVINDRSPGESSMEPLEEGLRACLNCGSKDLIEISSDLTLNSEGVTSQVDYASLAKVAAMVASQDLDVMIADQPTIDSYAADGAFFDLSQLLDPQLWEQVGDQAYLADSGEEGGPIPCALSLEDTCFSQLTGISMSPPYLAVIRNSERTEAAESMIQWLFSPACAQ